MELEIHRRRLNDIGLNHYESSAYMVLIGHGQFKALEVAGRANIPRAKIYDVLNGLVDKGFVRVVHGKVKQFSAVEPRLALEGFLKRRRDRFLREWTDRQKVAQMLSSDLAQVFQDGSNGNSPLDYLRIIGDMRQIAEEFRQMLLQTRNEYLEFARPPYGVDPGHEPIVRTLADRGTTCKLMFDSSDLRSPVRREELSLLEQVGAEVRVGRNVPMKLALFDSHSGMISLNDPVVSQQKITALVFEHRSLGSAMRMLFVDSWNRSSRLADFRSNASGAVE